MRLVTHIFSLEDMHVGTWEVADPTDVVSVYMGQDDVSHVGDSIT